MIKTIQNEAKEADGSMAEAREAVKQGMKQTEVVATAFQDILKSVDTVSETVMQVATAAEEQSATSIQISKNVEGINDITQQSAVGIQQIAQTAEQLRKLMVNLQQLLRNFTLNQVKSKNLVEHDKESYSLLNATMAINPN